MAVARPIVWHGVYTQNISRQGLSFLHSEQLFPSERMLIVLSSDLLCEIEVVRCRRIQRRCYEIGAKFVGDRRGEPAASSESGCSREAYG